MAQNLHLEPKKEVMTMLELAESLANHWPMEWKKYGDSDALCLMARTYHQVRHPQSLAITLRDFALKITRACRY